MTSVTSTNAKLDQIDLSVTASNGQTRGTVPFSPPEPRKTGLTGLTSGNPDFDQLLDRLHVAFGELARTDDDSNTAAAAADDLSSTYTSITGRSQPQADASAGALATDLSRGLAALPTSLTDQRGQNMLRSL